MDQKTYPENSNTPLARAFTIRQLPGWISKELEVPPGRLGVVIEPDGKVRTFPAGHYRLISTLDRLRGKAVGMRVGYIPAEPFNAMLEAQYLLSGDGVLVDASLALAVSVADPARYFNEQVLPRQEISLPVIELSEANLRASLGVLARQYAATDLARGLPTSRLESELRDRLGAVLRNQGLAVAAIPLISFWRSDERAEVAEKLHALEERLQDVELQKQMAHVENQVQMDDFVHQLQPQDRPAAGLRLALPSTGGAPAAGEAVKNHADYHQQAQAQQQPPLAQVQALFRRRAAPAAPAAARFHSPPPGWWTWRAIWIAFLILTGVVITTLALWIGQDISRQLLIGFVTGVWLLILPLILNSLKALMEKREEFAQKAWQVPQGLVGLEVVVGNDRQRADQLVRQQCAAELVRGRDLLNDARSRAYKAGAFDLALRLRELEHRMESSAEKVHQPGFGAPNYLGSLNIDEHGFAHALDYDEDLMLYAGALSEKIAATQSQLATGNPPDGLLEDLESHLDTFTHRFAGRTRLLQPPVG